MKISILKELLIAVFVAAALLSFPGGLLAQTCGSVFPDGLQTHLSTGQILFKPNAALINNPDNILAAFAIENPNGGGIKSCDLAHCTASGEVADPLAAVVFPINSSDVDVTVPVNGTAHIEDGGNQFNTIQVRSNAKLVIAHQTQGEVRIKHLDLESNADVTLAPGDYWVEQITFASNIKITLSGTGTVRLFVGGTFITQSGNEINYGTGSTQAADRLLVYSEGAMELASSTKIAGVLYAGAGAKLKSNALLHGALSAETVEMDSNSRVHHVANIPPALLNGLCSDTGQVDADGDGLPDSVDDDIDGDGFANNLEEQAGTDPGDASDMPMDNNGNGVPDALEIYTNACSAGFTNGLQVNNAAGVISFGSNAQLFNASSYELKTLQLSGPNGGHNPTCDGAACYASGTHIAPITLPQFKSTASGQSYNQSGTFTLGDDGANQFLDIRVRANGDLAFSPVNSEYLIKSLDLNANASVTFAPGDYWVESLTLSSNTEIFLSGNGLVRLFVLNGFTANANVKINSPGGGEGDSGRLLLVTWSGVTLKSNTVTSAVIYTPEAVSVLPGADVYGAINGGSISLSSNAEVYYRPEATQGLDFGSLCDLDGDGIYDGLDDDADGDGFSNAVEEQEGTNLFSADSVPPDLDGDFIPDALDPDMDGDGVANEDDIFPQDPSEWADLDGDGAGDNSDPDRDGDGFSNEVEEQVGTDPSSAGSVPPDLDGDSVPDSLDSDMDGDGVPNESDVFPQDSSEWADLDGDGVGDNSDPDRDGDGFSNEVEEQVGTDPSTASSVPPDLDGDFVPDSLDSDIDGDGVPNESDVFPQDPSEWADLDSDGVGDNSDADKDGDGVSNEVEIAAGTDPEDPQDYPDIVPPVIGGLSPNGGQVEGANFTLTGMAYDPQQPNSGIAGIIVTSDRYPSAEFVASLTPGGFTIDLPLKVELNQFLITVSDFSDNTATASVTIDRISPPKFANVTPQNGEVVTSDSVTIAGEVHTLLPLTDVRFFVNEWQITPSGTGVEGVYTFELDGIPLELGANSFDLVTQTSDGTATQNLAITYTPENAANIPAPDIVLLSPADGSAVSSDAVRVAVRITSEGGPLTVSLNGSQKDIPESQRTDFNLSEIVEFPEDGDQLDITIAATDKLGKNTTLTATFFRDASEPVIVIDNSIDPVPAINTLQESPYTLSGTVYEASLANFLINDKSVPLTPGAEPNSYRFSVALQIPRGQQTPIHIQARDTAGNIKPMEYVLENNSQNDLQALVPADNATLISDGAEDIHLQVVARAGQIQAGESVQIIMDGATPVPLAVAGTLASGNVVLPPQSGSHTLTWQIVNAQGAVVAQTARTVNVQSNTDIPLQVVRVEPENAAQNIEPNATIEFYFNKPVTLDQLQLSVKETLHGHTYINNDPPGTGFLEAKGYELQEVHRDMAPVPGSLDLLPGGKSVVFAPGQFFGFGAEILVELTQGAEELSRTAFKVRPLPTFINGSVRDQFGQPLAGITVTMPELDRTAVTNGDGGFAFGYQETGEALIKGGRYKLIVNDNFKAPGFGTHLQTVIVQEGRRNPVAAITLQEINRDIPFSQISTGQVNHLDGGDLLVDLSDPDARIYFSNGSDSGRIHTQFLTFEQLGVSAYQRALPNWMYSIQPKGIEVAGPVKLDIAMPPLRGSYEYLPDIFQYVVLLGYNPQRGILEPIGVGKIDNHRVTSIGEVNLRSLDYIGYALVHPGQSALLEAVANGETTIEQLKAELQ